LFGAAGAPEDAEDAEDAQSAALTQLVARTINGVAAGLQNTG